MLCLSVTVSGLQTTLSRMVAARLSQGRHREARACLNACVFLCLFLSFAAVIFIQRYALQISSVFLKEPRCKDLLIVLSWAIPFASLHSCICGFYIGQKGTRVPALSQLLEQCMRIGFVWLFYSLGLAGGMKEPILSAVYGLVIGEIAAASYSIFTVRKSFPCSLNSTNILPVTAELLRSSIPLTANRVLLNLLQSAEAVSIPVCLRLYGLPAPQALSVYGVLTGMALPCILFPSTLTGSVSTMLLPEIARIQASSDKSELKPIAVKVCSSCFLLGILCMSGFFILGNWIGAHLFGSDLAGKFILILSFICPFLYMNGALVSILNGLGKTGTTFAINTLSLIIRICGVFFLIPLFSIQGYLWGLLGSQLFTTLACILCAGMEIGKYTSD